MDLSRLIKQKPYEKIKLVVRKHPVTFVPTVLFFILLLAVPAAIYILVKNSLLAGLLGDPGYRVVIILLASAYLLSAILFFYTFFVTFYLDLWIITNDRLVDMEQRSLFSRTMTEVDLYQIQDATSEVKGIFPSLFNYGDIIVQTAGPLNQFTFRKVPNPHQMRQTIMDLAIDDKKFHENPGK